MVVELPVVFGLVEEEEPLLAGVEVVVPLPEELAGFDDGGTRVDVMLLKDMTGSEGEFHVMA